MSMRTLRNICVGLLFCASFAFAQTTDTTDRSKLIGLRFSFNGLNLSGGLGAKYWLTQQGAIALGMNIAANSQLTRTFDYSLGFVGQYEYHLARNNQISPYIAGGITVGFGSNELVTRTLPSSRPFLSIGASALIGAEIFITPNISIAGQQAFTMSYSWRDVSGVNSPPVFIENINLGLGNTSLVLQIYFGRI